MTKSPRPEDHSRKTPTRSGTAIRKQALSRRRLWLFRFFALFLFPVFVLGFLELALSFAGYGYPTSYFVNSRVAGQDFLIPNDRFGYRFFPAALVRTPINYRIPSRKQPDVYRIFVFGESAALGDPDPSYGVSRYLDVLLAERFPDAEFEVICVAMTAINSHVILPIARECVRLEGDLWIIYMGNNEMIGPFGAGTIFGPKAPGLGFVRTSLALKKMRLGQLISSVTSQPGSKSKAPEEWTGIDMFTRNLLRHDDPARLRAYRNFEGNLKDILKAGREAGVPVLLSTVASNLKDCAPFASLHRENLDASLKADWDRYFSEGLALEKTGQYEDALSRYKEAAAIDSEFAELPYRMAICQLALGHAEQAREGFLQARNHDALAVRADTRINRILMDTTPGDGGQLLRMDAVEALSAHSPEGIPGEELFYEHVHFTAEGNYTLARIVADQVVTLLPPEILESQADRWLEPEACNRLLALTLWDQMRLWQQESKRINTMPFVSQTSNPLNKNHINQKKNEITARNTGDAQEQDLQLYKSALDRAPEDPILIANYTLLLDAAGKRAEAIEQAERCRALLPDLEWPNYCLASLLAKEGRPEEAREVLEKALEIRSDFTKARELLKQINGK